MASGGVQDGPTVASGGSGLILCSRPSHVPVVGPAEIALEDVEPVYRTARGYDSTAWVFYRPHGKWYAAKVARAVARPEVWLAKFKNGTVSGYYTDAEVVVRARHQAANDDKTRAATEPSSETAGSHHHHHHQTATSHQQKWPSVRESDRRRWLWYREERCEEAECNVFWGRVARASKSTNDSSQSQREFDVDFWAEGDARSERPERRYGVPLHLRDQGTVWGLMDGEPKWGSEGDDAYRNDDDDEGEEDGVAPVVVVKCETVTGDPNKKKRDREEKRKHKKHKKKKQRAKEDKGTHAQAQPPVLQKRKHRSEDEPSTTFIKRKKPCHLSDSALSKWLKRDEQARAQAPKFVDADDVLNAMDSTARPTDERDFRKLFETHDGILDDVVEITNINVVHGFGVKAKEELSVGEVFYDVGTIFMPRRKVPENEHSEHYIERDGEESVYKIHWFRGDENLVASRTFYLNEARGDVKPNVEWKGVSHKRQLIQWRVLRRINAGEELLVTYDGASSRANAVRQRKKRKKRVAALGTDDETSSRLSRKNDEPSPAASNDDDNVNATTTGPSPSSSRPIPKEEDAVLHKQQPVLPLPVPEEPAAPAPSPAGSSSQRPERRRLSLATETDDDDAARVAVARAVSTSSDDRDTLDDDDQDDDEDSDYDDADVQFVEVRPAARAAPEDVIDLTLDD